MASSRQPLDQDQRKTSQIRYESGAQPLKNPISRPASQNQFQSQGRYGGTQRNQGNQNRYCGNGSNYNQQYLKKKNSDFDLSAAQNDFPVLPEPYTKSFQPPVILMIQILLWCRVTMLRCARVRMIRLQPDARIAFWRSLLIVVVTVITTRRGRTVVVKPLLGRNIHWRLLQYPSRQLPIWDAMTHHKQGMMKNPGK